MLEAIAVDEGLAAEACPQRLDSPRQPRRLLASNSREGAVLEGEQRRVRCRARTRMLALSDARRRRRAPARPLPFEVEGAQLGAMWRASAIYVSAHVVEPRAVGSDGRVTLEVRGNARGGQWMRQVEGVLQRFAARRGAGPGIEQHGGEDARPGVVRSSRTRRRLARRTAGRLAHRTAGQPPHLQPAKG